MSKALPGVPGSAVARWWAAITTVVGPDECLLVVALGLLTVGGWAVVGRAILVLPGATLLWMVLPARLPFVMKPPDPAAPRPRPKG